MGEGVLRNRMDEPITQPKRYATKEKSVGKLFQSPAEAGLLENFMMAIFFYSNAVESVAIMSILTAGCAYLFSIALTRWDTLLADATLQLQRLGPGSFRHSFGYHRLTTRSLRNHV